MRLGVGLVVAAADDLGGEHGGAEDERHGGDRADHARRRAAVDAGPVHGGVALAAGDQPAVDGNGDDAGDHEREREAAPEQQRADAGVHRAGDATTIALSTISMTAMLSVSEASAIGMTAPSARPARSSGTLVSV